jgi:hypothetical protein
MLSNTLVKLERPDVLQVLESAKSVLKDGAFNPDTVTMLGQDIPFYPGYRFIDAADYSVTPNVRKFLVWKAGDAVVLNWTNEPIYRLNDRAPLNINEDNIIDYVRFFFTYIRGRHGRFIIVESVDDIAWSEEPPAAARKAIGQMIGPVQIKGIDKDGTFHLSACMVFKDSLFRTDVHVKPNGMVDLSGEELLIEDMPVLDDTFGQ